MRLSTSPAELGVVAPPGWQDRVQDIGAPAGEREDGLVMGSAFGALAGLEGPAGRVTAHRDESGLVEDPLEGLVAGLSRLQAADLAGLLEDERQACRGGELVAVREAVDAAGDGEELGGEGGRMRAGLRMRAASGWRARAAWMRLPSALSSSAVTASPGQAEA